MNRGIIPEPIEFDWDEGNVSKNFKKHGITNQEAEEVFLNKPLVYEDRKHSGVEARYDALGVSDGDREVFISFTMRGSKIRMISVRRMSRKERKKYAEEIQKNT